MKMKTYQSLSEAPKGVFQRKFIVFINLIHIGERKKSKNQLSNILP